MVAQDTSREAAPSRIDVGAQQRAIKQHDDVMEPRSLRPRLQYLSALLGLSPNMAFNRTPAYASSFSRASVGGRRLT